jgi:hypothetical protein
VRVSRHYTSRNPETPKRRSTQSRAHGHGTQSQEAQTWEKGAGVRHVMGQAPSRRCHISSSDPVGIGGSQAVFQESTFRETRDLPSTAAEITEVRNVDKCL